ncbi:MAG: thiamine-binding protein [Williamsia sp.]|nr:thiamine-binding protein [Williamsia sp.]
MHQYIVNASIQLLPIVQDKHPYEWVDEAIAVIKQSGLPYEVGPFATTMEGRYEQVMELVNQINEHLYKQSCTEWIANVQIQIRSGEDITGGLKTEKHKV